MLLVANASLSCSSSTWFRRFLNNGANIERSLEGSALPDAIWELTSFDYARHAARDGPVVIAGPPLSSLSAGEHGEWVDGLFSYLLTVEADPQILQRRQPDGSGDLADYLRDIYCSRASDPRRVSGRPVKCVPIPGSRRSSLLERDFFYSPGRDGSNVLYANSEGALTSDPSLAWKKVSVPGEKRRMALMITASQEPSVIGRRDPSIFVLTQESIKSGENFGYGKLVVDAPAPEPALSLPPAIREHLALVTTSDGHTVLHLAPEFTVPAADAVKQSQLKVCHAFLFI